MPKSIEKGINSVFKELNSKQNLLESNNSKQDLLKSKKKIVSIIIQIAENNIAKNFKYKIKSVFYSYYLSSNNSRGLSKLLGLE